MYKFLIKEFIRATKCWFILLNLEWIVTHNLFSSVAQSCPTLCNPMDSSTPGLPVHHQCPEFTKTHVHWVGDAILLSHPLSSPSPAFNLSRHQSLFKWVSSSHQVAKQSTGVSASTSVLPVNIQDWFPLGLAGWISLQSKLHSWSPDFPGATREAPWAPRHTSWETPHWRRR